MAEKGRSATRLGPVLGLGHLSADATLPLKWEAGGGMGIRKSNASPRESQFLQAKSSRDPVGPHGCPGLAAVGMCWWDWHGPEKLLEASPGLALGCPFLQSPQQPWRPVSVPSHFQPGKRAQRGQATCLGSPSMETIELFLDLRAPSPL